MLKGTPAYWYWCIWGDLVYEVPHYNRYTHAQVVSTVKIKNIDRLSEDIK